MVIATTLNSRAILSNSHNMLNWSVKLMALKHIASLWKKEEKPLEDINKKELQSSIQRKDPKKKYPNGTCVRKYFKKEGKWYNGQVVHYDKYAELYSVKYKAGDKWEEISHDDLYDILLLNHAVFLVSVDDDDEYDVYQKSRKEQKKLLRDESSEDEYEISSDSSEISTETEEEFEDEEYKPWSKRAPHPEAIRTSSRPRKNILKVKKKERKRKKDKKKKRKKLIGKKRHIEDAYSDESDDDYPIMKYSPSNHKKVKLSTPNRGRGRPPKEADSTVKGKGITAQGNSGRGKTKRGPGRPRKSESPVTSALASRKLTKGDGGEPSKYPVLTRVIKVSSYRQICWILACSFPRKKLYQLIGNIMAFVLRQCFLL
jgi:hypothetical protein